VEFSANGGKFRRFCIETVSEAAGFLKQLYSFSVAEFLQGRSLAF
jgi:hypothetical protein